MREVTQPMRVGIDAKSLLPPRAGVARYVEGLLAGCSAVDHPDVEIAVVKPDRARRTLPWVLFDLQRATGEGYAAFHFPFYYPPLWPRCPATVAIHDVLVIEHPEWFSRAWTNPLRLLIPRGARHAAAIFTGSTHVADSIAEVCRVPRELVHVTGLAVDHHLFAPPSAADVEAARRRLQLPPVYLVQLGALEPRRGVDLAVAAVRELRLEFPDLGLVLVGEERTPVPGLADLPPWLHRIRHVADADLPALLFAAQALLAPSRGEGFDFPVLEAMCCGAAVVASDIPVHREHFAPAVALFESGDAGALAAAVRGVLADSALSARLREEGPRLAATFTWEAVAARHLEIWRQLGTG